MICYDDALNCLGHHPMDGFAMDIHEQNGLLYAASGKAGLVILKPEGNALRELGRYDFGGPACAQVVPSENGHFVMAHIGEQHYSILDVSDPAAIVESERGTDAPGLLYHRQLTRVGAGGRYYGFYLNSNDIRWYDFSGDKPVRMEWHQGRLGYQNGVTGLREEYQALTVLRGGYTVFDIRKTERLGVSGIVTIPDVLLLGKPVIDGKTLFVTDRLRGNVIVCDITDLRAPKLLAQYNFSGHPDMACPVGDGAAVIPLGHQGIALITFD